MLTTAQSKEDLWHEGTWWKSIGFLTFGWKFSFYNTYLLFLCLYFFSFFPQKCSVP